MTWYIPCQLSAWILSKTNFLSFSVSNQYLLPWPFILNHHRHASPFIGPDNCLDLDKKNIHSESFFWHQSAEYSPTSLCKVLTMFQWFDLPCSEIIVRMMFEEVATTNICMTVAIQYIVIFVEKYDMIITSLSISDLEIA